jgi:hypothetical protein
MLSEAQYLILRLCFWFLELEDLVKLARVCRGTRRLVMETPFNTHLVLHSEVPHWFLQDVILQKKFKTISLELFAVCRLVDPRDFLREQKRVEGKEPPMIDNYPNSLFSRIMHVNNLSLMSLKLSDDWGCILPIEDWFFLSKITTLEDLDLSLLRITDKVLATFSRLRLRKLNLANSSGITDAGLQHLSGMSLHSLNLTNCREVTDSGLQSLSGMSLQHLVLGGCSAITDTGLQSLSGMPLQKLYLNRCSRITDSGLQSLSGMPLRHLDLGGCSGITDTGLQSLSGMSLQHLVLGGCSGITDAGLRSLSGMPLQHLDLGGCSVQHLDLGGFSGITDTGLQFLSGMPLKHLDLFGCSQITDTGLQSLSGMPLQRLNLSNCWHITGTGLQSLSGMPLQRLDLWGCSGITDAGLQNLSGMPLQYLDLDGCSAITDAGLQSLSGMPLQKLYLNGCSRITDDGLQYLSGMPLQHLDLAGCKVGDDGIRFIGEVKSLKSLSLSRTDVTGNELKGLKDLQLRNLKLDKCKYLESLSSLPPTLTNLDVVDCKNLPTREFKYLLGIKNLQVLNVETSSRRVELLEILESHPYTLVNELNFEGEEEDPWNYSDFD